MKRLAVKVIPNSKKNEVNTIEESLIVRVTASPVDGKANKAAIRILAKHFNVKKRSIRIVQGEKARNKVIEIDSD